MESEGAGQGSVLIVATNRDDRRVLFDTLDAQGFDAIYTAKDLPQAHALLAQDPSIDVVVLEFVGQAREAVAFCTQLKGNARLAHVPVIGIQAGNPTDWPWGWSHMPPGLLDWIRSPVDGSEALARVRIAVATHRGTGVPPPAANAGSDHYQFVFDGSQDEIVVSDPKSGRILDVNATFVQRSGVAKAQAIGTALQALDLTHTRAQHAAFAEQLGREGSVMYRCAKPHADGGSYPVEVHTRLAVQDGQLIHFSVFRQHGELARYQEVLTLLGNVATRAGGSGDEGLGAIARQVVEWLDLDYLSVLALRTEHGEAQPLVTFQRASLAPDAPDPLKQPSLKRVLGGETLAFPAQAPELLAEDAWLRHTQWEMFIGLPLRDDRKTTLGALLLARAQPLPHAPMVLDALRVLAGRIGLELELKRAREHGRAKGLQDVLTGLPNRLLFNDRLETTIREAHRTGEMFAVLFVDLDRFKTINDSLGHSVGDQVLIGVARRLRASVRASDTVARYAGDEFILILRHIVQREDVMRLAEKIVRVMEAPLTLADGGELHITASIGVSFYPDDALTAERLVKHADIAMYSAKGMGRNNFQTYVAMPEESHMQRLALETKLRQAEKNNELRVFYQPQVNTQTEDIVGMEALIRWEHPELGMISPGFFIPLAEDTGLILSIGEWVLREACADARRWQIRFGLGLRIGVNLSALQLRQPGFVQIVRDVLTETGLDPAQLDLEVTESISVKSITGLQESLEALRALGCKISIDDFGTGQSSLDYIKRFPSDRIKIDQSFVRNIGVDPDDEAIVQATIGMAHNLGRGVVAEGVEIEAHLEFLRLHQCEELQGYLFCRPLPAASFEKMLIERERLFAGFA